MPKTLKRKKKKSIVVKKCQIWKEGENIIESFGAC
jgi:hypothetical protein